MLAITLLAILIIAAWLRVVRFGGPRSAGPVIYDAPLPLLARFRMQSVPSALLIGAALAMWVFWTLPPWGVALALVAVAALIAAPVRYTLTPTGIRLGWTPYRRWTEFAGVYRSAGGARLQGAAGQRDMRIWLSGDRADDQFVLLLRRMITNAYKGRTRLQQPAMIPGDATPSDQLAASVEITHRAS